MRRNRMLLGSGDYSAYCLSSSRRRSCCECTNFFVRPDQKGQDENSKLQTQNLHFRRTKYDAIPAVVDTKGSVLSDIDYSYSKGG
jgi:hypothetical protein